ncbi:hypothetical protein [Nocardiopsis mangrovi]
MGIATAMPMAADPLIGGLLDYLTTPREDREPPAWGKWVALGFGLLILIGVLAEFVSPSGGGGRHGRGGGDGGSSGDGGGGDGGGGC